MLFRSQIDYRLFRVNLPDPIPTQSPEKPSVRVLLSLEDGKAPTRFRLFKAGHNETEKGVFTFSEKSQAEVLAAAARWGNDFPIDYCHAMLAAAWANDPSEAGKAAGHFTLAVESGELWATNVQWTPAGRAKVEAKEFRYISPAFDHESDGVICEITNVVYIRALY